MNILITICARGGSKGIPGKNIKPINGRPLIGYTIDVAFQFKEFFQTVDIALRMKFGKWPVLVVCLLITNVRII